MAVTKIHWHSPEAQTDRDDRLAQIFNGYNYVLSILAEIHPGFVRIKQAHVKAVMFNSAKTWSPVIYKIVSLDAPTRIAYLIGSCHMRFVPLYEHARLQQSRQPQDYYAFAQRILSEKIQKILKSSDAFAAETLEAYSSENYRSKMSMLAIQYPVSQDQMQMQMRLNLVIHEMGLEESAHLFLLQEQNRPLALFEPPQKLFPAIDDPQMKAIVFSSSDRHLTALFSLESEEVHLRAGQELLSGALDNNFDEAIKKMDLAISGDSESQEQFFSSRNNHELLQHHMQWRNTGLAESIFHYMSGGNTTTFMVGVDHLYGVYGILNLLSKKGNISITVFEE